MCWTDYQKIHHQWLRNLQIRFKRFTFITDYSIKEKIIIDGGKISNSFYLYRLKIYNFISKFYSHNLFPNRKNNESLTFVVFDALFMLLFYCITRWWWVYYFFTMKCSFTHIIWYSYILAIHWYIFWAHSININK